MERIGDVFSSKQSVPAEPSPERLKEAAEAILQLQAEGYDPEGVVAAVKALRGISSKRMPTWTEFEEAYAAAMLDLEEQRQREAEEEYLAEFRRLRQSDARKTVTHRLTSRKGMRAD